MKLAIIVRKDLGMSCGKIAVQVGHASVAAYDYVCHFHYAKAMEWLYTGQKKIVLKVESEALLHNFHDFAARNGINCEKIYDFGLTQISPNTLTCIAIGPDEDKKIDEIVGGLKLL
jgi:peptidyl-tRNA hydrolase, PTH2 family